MKIDMNIYGGNNMVIQDGGVVSTQTFVDGKLVHQRITLNGKDVTNLLASAPAKEEEAKVSRSQEPSDPIERILDIDSSWSHLTISGNISVYIAEDESERITAIGSEADLDALNVSLENNALRITLEGKNHTCGAVKLRIHHPAGICSLEALENAQIQLHGAFHLNDIDLSDKCKLVWEKGVMESPYLCIASFSTGGIQINGLKGTSLLLNAYVGGRVHITEADIQHVTLDASRNAEIFIGGEALDATLLGHDNSLINANHLKAQIGSALALDNSLVYCNIRHLNLNREGNVTNQKRI